MNVTTGIQKNAVAAAKRLRIATNIQVIGKSKRMHIVPNVPFMT